MDGQLNCVSLFVRERRAWIDLIGIHISMRADDSNVFCHHPAAQKCRNYRRHNGCRLRYAGLECQHDMIAWHGGLFELGKIERRLDGIGCSSDGGFTI